MLLPSAGQATTILVAVTPKVALIAADGLVSDAANRAGEPMEWCKIRRCGQHWFAVSGLYANSFTGFDAFGLLEASCRPQDELEEAIGRAEFALAAPFETALRDYDRRIGARALKPMRLDVLFVGMGLQGPEALTLSLRRAEAGGIRPTRGAAARQDTARPVQVIYFGETDAFADQTGEPVTMPIESLFLSWLQQQALQTPAKVGPPYSLLLIERDGHRWLRGGACAGD